MGFSWHNATVQAPAGLHMETMLKFDKDVPELREPQLWKEKPLRAASDSKPPKGKPRATPGAKKGGPDLRAFLRLLLQKRSRTLPFCILSFAATSKYQGFWTGALGKSAKNRYGSGQGRVFPFEPKGCQCHHSMQKLKDLDLFGGLLEAS